ncbi:MAG: hypothetical protein ACTSPB_19480, partial [Candidatus Thorarchaeota archaeon]
SPTSYVVDDTKDPVITGTLQRDPVEVTDLTPLVNISIANVEEETGSSGIDTVKLLYRVDPDGDGPQSFGAWIPEDIAGTGPPLWGEIPPYDYPSVVQYYIEATDNAGNTASTSTDQYEVAAVIVFGSITRNVSSPEYNDPVLISIANVSSGAYVQNVSLNYSTDGGSTWHIKTYNESDFGTNQEYTDELNWTIGSLEWNTQVQYRIQAWDKASPTNNYKESQLFSYTVGDSVAPGITLITSGRNVTDPIYTDALNLSVADVSDQHVNASGIDSLTISISIDFAAWTTHDINSTWCYELSAQSYGRNVRYFFNATDNAGNSYLTSTYSYSVGDTIDPVITSVDRNEQHPDYDTQVVITVDASEPADASGIDSIILIYSSNNWMSNSSQDITLTRNGTLPYYSYGTTVRYMINITDVAGNWVTSNAYSYFVNDTKSPSISGISRNVTSPEYDDVVNVSVSSVSEPGLASGVASVLLRWSNDSQTTWNDINITGTKSGNAYWGNIPDHPYGIVIYYKINATDVEGNSVESSVYSYTVTDTVSPTYGTSANVYRSISAPDYYQDVNITIPHSYVSDHHVNASGVYYILLKYSVEGGSLQTVNLTGTNNGSDFYWGTIPAQDYDSFVIYRINVTDNAGNSIEVQVGSYTVGDTVAPIIGTIDRNPTVPEYDDSVTITVQDVTEPASASGIQQVLLNTSSVSASGPWTTSDITGSKIPPFTGIISSYSYGTTIYYLIIVEDKAGNREISSVYSYVVNDTTEPQFGLIQRNVTNPEYYEGVNVSISGVSEPPAASGVWNVYINITINGTHDGLHDINGTYSTGGNYYYIFNPADYGTIVEYTFVANDTEGNIKESSTQSFNYQDTVPPSLTGDPSLQYDGSDIDYNENVTVQVSFNSETGDSGISEVNLLYSNDAWTNTYEV